MTLARAAALLGAVFCLAASADPADRLADPVREARARSLFRETRCLVCQGQSIDDSDADLAADLRRAIRGRLAVGATDAQVRDFLVARYGEFVLFRPRLSVVNTLLWGSPFAVAAFGVGLLIRRGRGVAASPALSSADEARLIALGVSPACDTFAPELRSKNDAGLTET